ncbi:MAG: flagellar hook protein FlgE, partial [Pseudomonadota bacterium]|nr:flagellar hook protein FlgE [Pseudomonadota bacterium]
MGVSYDLNALSGINAASNGLGVISNNLANSQTVGFKSSRAEFADMFSGAQNSPGNGVRVESITQDFNQGTITGTGRELDMAIDGEGFFILDDKNGKYDAVYTRNGSFKLDKDGYLTDQSDNKVQGYLLSSDLSTETSPVFDTTLSSIDLDDVNKDPRATDEMFFDINLDGQEQNNIDPNAVDTNGNGSAADEDSVGINANLAMLLDPENNGAYDGFPDFSTNKIIHDSLGGEHRLTANFYKRDVVPEAVSTVDQDGDGNFEKYTSWIVQYTMQDYDEDNGEWITSGHRFDQAAGAVTTEAGQIFELRFDTNGELIDVRQPDDGAGNYDSTAIGGVDDDVDSELGDVTSGGNWVTLGVGQAQLDFMIDTPLTGAFDPLGDPTDATVSVAMNFDEMTQFSGTYNIRGVSQNGYKVGDLVGLTTDLDGVIQARYSNGRSIPVAQLALANFTDKNAMEKLGGQTYAETFASGTRQLAAPQTIGMGTINAGSLEYSNVDVAGELVNMIQTQRTYQASAQVISTSQTLTQTILNL